MKVAIIGGHLAPALAVIKALPENAETIFIGRKYGFEGDRAMTLEYQTVTGLKIPFYELNAGRLQRSFSRNTIPSLLRFPFGILQARAILQKTRPDVVLGFGGYVSLSVAYAARSLRIPVVIHEQTLGLGLANKLIASFAKKVCISWESSRKFLKTDNVIVTGNPIREEIMRPVPPDFAESLAQQLPIVYVTGGSAGSHALNELVMGCLEQLVAKAVVVHQTGDARQFNDFDMLMRKREGLLPELQKRYIVRKFIDPHVVGYVMQKASLIVSRSGINTVSELLFLKKPALLVPLPNSQAQEQVKNAQFLHEVGLAEILDQQNTCSDEFSGKIISMITHQNMYTIKKDEKTHDRFRQAAKNIVSVIEEISRPENRTTEKAGE